MKPLNIFERPMERHLIRWGMPINQNNPTLHAGEVPRKIYFRSFYWQASTICITVQNLISASKTSLLFTDGQTDIAKL